MVESLTEFAANFATAPMVASRQMRRLFAAQPTAFIRATIVLVRSGAFDSGCQYALTLLVSNERILEEITAPDSFSVREAVEIAQRIQSTIDTLLDVKLIRRLVARHGIAPVVSDISVALRTLEVVGAISDGSRVMTLLTQLLAHTDRRVGSKVALLIGRFNHNLKWVEQRMADPDGRVRANAVESLWGMNTVLSVRVFAAACRDGDNRVAGNGALGLYHAGDPHGAEVLSEMICRDEADFRATAAWAMGETADPRFLQSLSARLAETDAGVRPHIFQAISKIRRRTKESRDAGSLKVIVTGSQVSDSVRRLSLAVFKEPGQGITGLSPMNVIVADTGVILHRASVKLGREAEPSLIGFIFPRFMDTSDPLRLALLECLKGFAAHKKRLDRWGAIRYSPAAPLMEAPLSLTRSLVGGRRSAPLIEATVESDVEPVHFSDDARTVMAACETAGARSASAQTPVEAVRRLLNAMGTTTRVQKAIYLFVSEERRDTWDDLRAVIKDARVTMRALTLGFHPQPGLTRLCAESGGGAAPVLTPADFPAAAARAAAALASSCEIEYQIPEGSTGLVKVQVHTPDGFGEDTFVCE